MQKIFYIIGIICICAAISCPLLFEQTKQATCTVLSEGQYCEILSGGAHGSGRAGGIGGSVGSKLCYYQVRCVINNQVYDNSLADVSSHNLGTEVLVYYYDDPTDIYSYDKKETFFIGNLILGLLLLLIGFFIGCFTHVRNNK